MGIYFYLEIKVQTTAKLWQKIFHWRKCIWKFRLINASHSKSASMCWYYLRHCLLGLIITCTRHTIHTDRCSNSVLIDIEICSTIFFFCICFCEWGLMSIYVSMLLQSMAGVFAHSMFVCFCFQSCFAITDLMWYHLTKKGYLQATMSFGSVRRQYHD